MVDTLYNTGLDIKGQRNERRWVTSIPLLNCVFISKVDLVVLAGVGIMDEMCISKKAPP